MSNLTPKEVWSQQSQAVWDKLYEQDFVCASPMPSIADLLPLGETASTTKTMMDIYEFKIVREPGMSRVVMGRNAARDGDNWQVVA